MNFSEVRRALNPAYRKHKPLRKDVSNFVEQLQDCLKTIIYSDRQNESEEHLKEPIKKFFKNTFYQDNLINTKHKVDLAIYLGKNAKSDIGVLIEAKKPSNKSEFLTESDLNRKALHELLLYYLRERVDHGNNNIKHLIATNGYEWFFFKAEDFYNLFYKNKTLIKEYEAFRDGLKDTNKNELFYNEIAKKFISEVEPDLPFVYLNFQDYDFSNVRDTQLNTLFKIFSDVHLLGHSFGNDSNYLNKSFYNELLHIIGLEEIKDKGKKLIYRKSETNREYASLIENTIFTLEDRDYLSNARGFDDDDKKSFNVGLELCLTWINRILFLKLLESQLLTYHKGNKDYKFLNSKFINGFDELNNLFFSALAKKENERHLRYREKFKNIPYLNSSLFDRNKLEIETFEISALNDDEIQVYSSTVLKDTNGRKLTGKLNTLEYLFRFLDAYDFAADGTEGIEEGLENKTLINASVLGLIFEKINGYKEGSFYTPAHITMYMCKETLRKAVVQKFRKDENEQIENYEDLKAYCNRYFKTEDTQRFNAVFNSLKICDPAVGSGHFLVSALNELIAIKNELGILTDTDGIPLRCDIHVENDELFILDDSGSLFDYNPSNKESARIQRTIFHEKQLLIENCLFGVDINPNSVKICRLRLWIELLKNAYYTENNELQTLPNIDINIKNGNSLISRFKLQDTLKSAFKGNEVDYDFTDYKNAVSQYKNTNSKEKKREVLKIINEVKNNFISTLDNKFIKRFQKAQGDYSNEEERLNNLKKFGEKIKKIEIDNLKKLKLKAEKAFAEKEEIVNNIIYHNSFEWRFEFPEVLDNEGNFLGFDAVIGNPPYIQLQKMKEESEILSNFNYETFSKTGDIYSLFYELGFKVLKPGGILTYITSNKWMRAAYGKSLRKYFVEKSNPLVLIDFGGIQVFDSATVDTNILITEKRDYTGKTLACVLNKDFSLKNMSDYIRQNSTLIGYSSDSWMVLSPIEQRIKEKIENMGTPLKEWDVSINYGIKTGFNEAFIIDQETRNSLVEKSPKSAEIIRPILLGKDVKRYTFKWKNLWVIFTRRGTNIDEYPAIKNYLFQFYERLRPRNNGEKTGRKPGSYKWFETQDNIAYFESFSQRKLVGVI